MPGLSPDFNSMGDPSKDPSEPSEVEGQEEDEIRAPEPMDPTKYLTPLRLKDARLLLSNAYLPFEAGYGLTADNMQHVAVSTYMPRCTAAMIDWWFGWMHTTGQYKLWHPRDHVFSDWEGPRENSSEYVGGHHLVHEYIGGILSKLKISWKDPGEYFGPDWKADFKEAGYGTAACARVAEWDADNDEVTYNGHLIHLIKNEPDGCRMRSRFWLGDVEGMDEAIGHLLPPEITGGLVKHCTEEMSILASILPGLYQKYGVAKEKWVEPRGHSRRTSNL